MQATIEGKAERKGNWPAPPQDGFTLRKITYYDFVCSRLEGLRKGAREPYSAEEVKRLLLSDEFKEGLREIRQIAKALGNGGLPADQYGKDQMEKLANFASNVNAIVKNKKLFEELAKDPELRRDTELLGFAVSNAFPGAARRGFEKVKDSLPEGERLTKEERKRMLGAITNL